MKSSKLREDLNIMRGGMDMNPIEILNENRLRDLSYLLKSREKTGYNWSQLEIRNLLFIYGVSLSHKAPNIAINKFHDFSSQINCRSKNFTATMLKQIKKYCRYYQNTGSCRYKFSNERIIEMLNITNDEMMNLDSIISDEIREEIEKQIIEEEIERIRIEEQIEESIRNYQLEEEMRHFRDPIFDEDFDPFNPDEEI